ncbi:DUF3261 domain-containing protein [Litchfieldella rifensis]|uniref:DUF3261 domain-containing protein n=1 Tax=Litchfieldella rifensis TaxID=762643 RepID=A0ABV7LTE1_9GAMM
MRRPFLRHALLAAILALLFGCAGRPIDAPSPELSALPKAGPLTQRLTFTHQDQRHELLGVLRHDERSLRLVLLSPQGQRLLTLVRDARGARFLGGAEFEPPISAEWLANRLAWSLWPSSALIQAFDGSDWSLVEDRQGRTIHYRNRPIVRITGSAECRIIDDIEGGYRLRIAPLDDDTDRTADACPTA